MSPSCHVIKIVSNGRTNTQKWIYGQTGICHRHVSVRFVICYTVMSYVMLHHVSILFMILPSCFSPSWAASNDTPLQRVVNWGCRLPTAAASTLEDMVETRPRGAVSTLVSTLLEISLARKFVRWRSIAKSASSWRLVFIASKSAAFNDVIFDLKEWNEKVWVKRVFSKWNETTFRQWMREKEKKWESMS